MRRDHLLLSLDPILMESEQLVLEETQQTQKAVNVLGGPWSFCNNVLGWMRTVHNSIPKGIQDLYLALASLTRTNGRAKSSFNRWLCSVNLRSLSSDIDCCHDF